ncbi:dihydroorotate dehydrogenase [Marinilabilia rubra]|uniref:Dihydroorotate dehydrogenase n=1 Tax=Marinilabilia rubra TaxID=2162893 RepID=A0A2U2BAG9_9BACT|nr:dihydroorotate dehydrogenase [Marinilabilia rubra]PWE00065.1 dihydroorotate dehydrogenase [Marinilabilia rubra]
MVDLSVTLGNINLKNPVMTASGTFGYGEEYSDFINIEELGGIIVKGTTATAREGNAYPRMAETPMGMLNAVGLQNKGVDAFVNETWPRIKKYDTNFFVNVSGSTVEEYIETAEKIASINEIPGIELNISCPNVKEGGMAFGTSCPSAIAVTEAVRKVYPGHLMVKLSPNVTDVTEIAKGVEGAGADSVSLINTLLGMAIDAETRKPILSTVTGGLSGPCVKPVALRMVWQVASSVDIPVVGLGGISSARDAIEFLLAGASAIQVGTANFREPDVTANIISGISDYMERHNISEISDITGGLIIEK